MITAVMPTYGRKDVVFERGEGNYLYAADGRRYLDFTSGIAVNALGHCHPYLVKALTEQGQKLWHTSNLFRIGNGEKLAKRLVENSFADTMFFCNSGAEAIEGGIKLIRKYQFMNGQPKRYKIVCFQAAFHGRLLNALAATGNEKYLEGFGPPAPGYKHAPLNNTNVVRDMIDDETAGILVEPIQGEGGIRATTTQFLKDLRSICDEFGLLLFYDEIHTGFGRTGKMWGYDWSGVKPDVAAIAKGMGGGFPIGAVGGRADLLELTVAAMTPGYVTHAGTFNGHLAAAVAGTMTLRHLDAAAISRLNDAAAALADRILAGADAAGVPAEVTRAGSIMNVHLSDSGQLADLHLALLLHGVYTTPRGMINLSTALSPGDLDDIAAAYETAFTMARAA